MSEEIPLSVLGPHPQTLSEIRSRLEAKIAFRVVAPVGMVVGLYNVDWVGDQVWRIHDQEALAEVRFRAIVFRPRIDEVAVGVIKDSSSTGLCVALGEFFEGITIDPKSMPQPAFFEPTRSLWAWRFESHYLWMRVGQKIRFRVTCVSFRRPGRDFDVRSVKERLTGDAAATASEAAAEGDALTVQATIADSGLGLIAWWASGTE